jgi:hypothetical protein
VTNSDLLAALLDITLGATAIGLYLDLKPRLTHLINTLDTAVGQANQKLNDIDKRVSDHAIRISHLESE